MLLAYSKYGYSRRCLKFAANHVGSCLGPYGGLPKVGTWMEDDLGDVSFFLGVGVEGQSRSGFYRASRGP